MQTEAVEPPRNCLGGGALSVTPHPDDDDRIQGDESAALVPHMIGPRMSRAAAFAVFGRLTAELGGLPDPAGLLGEQYLRSLRLYSARTLRVLGLTQRQLDVAIDVYGLGA